jgi:hypothetical protein
MHGLLLQLQNMDTTTRYLIMAAAGLTIFYAVMRPMRRRKDPLGRPPISSLAGQRAVERDMSNLLVELSEMARQITAQIDTRAAKLELLIKEADEKLAALRSATLATPTPLTRPDDRPMQAAEALPPLDPAQREIYSLADEGRTPREIAARLNRPDGEVELILALRSAR